MSLVTSAATGSRHPNSPHVQLRTLPYTSVHLKPPEIEIFGPCGRLPWRDVKQRTPHPACGHVDSLAPARSARCGLSAPPNSFRRFPTDSSLPSRCGEGKDGAACHLYKSRTPPLFYEGWLPLRVPDVT